MLHSTRIAVAALAIATFSLPAAAQTPETTPSVPVPQVTPDTPAPPAATPCGQRLDLFIGSVLSQFNGAMATSEAQRRALDAFKSTADKAREMVRQACADEKSAASVRELEAAEKQLETALDSLRPAMDKLYGSLSDEQKVQLNALGLQLQGWLKDIWRDFALNLDQRPDADKGGRRDQFRFCFEDFCFSMPQQSFDDRRDYRRRDRDDFRFQRD
jgi:hypothetical protein